MTTSSTVEGLERGAAGTAKTIDRMHELVARAKLDPTIQKIAYWIRAQSGDARGSSQATADRIFWWVKRHGLFTRDPFQIEKIEDLLASMAPIVEARKAGTYRGRALFSGDCDTYSLWVAALGGILGFNYAFETVKVDRERPDEYSHVYTALRVGNDWYPLDPSTSSAGPGWRPPVGADMLRRWPEKPIEDAAPSLGEADDDEGNWNDPRNDSPLRDVDVDYPQDSVGPAQPRDFGYGPGVVPDADFSDLHLLPPDDTQQSEASLAPDMEALQAAPLIDPSRRIQEIAGQPDDHGNPYYRGGGRHPYYKLEHQPYPPGSQWNLDRGLDVRRYRASGPYIQKQEPGTPERKVTFSMEQPMNIRRRHVTVMTQPQVVPYGTMNGMGDIDPTTGILTFDSKPAVVPAPGAAANPTAATAGTSVWDSIANVASSIFKAAGTVVPATLQQKAALAVANATNKIAGQNVLAAGMQTPWYKSPWTWLGGALLVGGGAYVVMKNTGSRRGRRR